MQLKKKTVGYISDYICFTRSIKSIKRCLGHFIKEKTSFYQSKWTIIMLTYFPTSLFKILIISSIIAYDVFWSFSLPPPIQPRPRPPSWLYVIIFFLFLFKNTSSLFVLDGGPPLEQSKPTRSHPSYSSTEMSKALSLKHRPAS